MATYVQAPKFEFISNARPSLFAYPTPTKPPTKESVAMVETAVLSTTAKAKARERVKEKKKAAAAGVDAMETVSDLMSDFPGPLLYQISISNIKLIKTFAIILFVFRRLSVCFGCLSPSSKAYSGREELEPR